MRKAIALIELIFAIVVIGITLLSVPNIIKTTTKASSNIVTQESISILTSHLNMVMAQFWDENSTNPKYNNPILKVEQENTTLSEANDTKGYSLGRRIGSAISSPRRYATDINGTKLTATKVTNLGKDNNETDSDDIDDFDNTNSTLVDRNSTSSQLGDYKDRTVQVSTRVNYIFDNPTSAGLSYNANSIDFNDPFNLSKVSSTQSTNIKTISVTLNTNNTNNKTIVLRAFSCNIGSSRLKERKF